MVRQLRAQRQDGFSLVEVMVVVMVIAIIGAIALPNFQQAMKDTRRKTAYRAAIQIANAIELHQAYMENPPSYASMNFKTLQPLVDSKSMTAGEVAAAVARFEGEQIDSYFTWSGGGWNFGSEQAYIVYFRPQGEPNASCYIWSKWGRCWYPDTGTMELFTGDWW